MKIPRRRFLGLAAGAAAIPAILRSARAQTYPSRPVRLIVGFPPDSATDLFGRLAGQWLSERLDQPFVIENRAGAGSNIAAEAVVKAPPDGYTLLIITASNAGNATLYNKLNFDFIRDIAPVASISRGMGVLVVHPSLPARTVPEFIAYAKANPGKINMASPGNGSTPHLYGELFNAMTGVNMIHVPYRGDVFSDLIGGQVQVYFPPVAASIEFIRAGKLHALAVTGATRADVLPDIPTVGEFVPGYEASGWVGVGAPRRTPNDIIGKLNKEINAVLADPKVKARIADLGYTAFPSSPGDFANFIAKETEKWGKVVRAAHIRVE
jgi:tripartite-type tricarboxylate transporter receptor subunit TctC